MNEADRLMLRARQLMDDPTLPGSQRLSNAAALLRHLADSTKGTPQRESLLGEVDDASVRRAFRAALEAADAA